MNLFQGTFQSRGLALDLPRADIERALPKALALAERHGDLVPFFFLAGQQAIGPGGFQLAEVYSEAIFAVPGVVLRDDPDAGEFVWMPLLYVNQWLPIIVNLAYGFPKRIARFHWREDSLEIREPFAARPRVMLNWRDAEHGAAVDSHQRLADGAWREPAINFIAGVPLVSTMNFEPGEIIVPSAIDATFDVPSLPFVPRHADVAAIGLQTLGGFRTVQEYKFGLARRVGRSSAPKPPPTPSGPRRKVAILGGGVGAITAAFALTSLPNWQSEFEITVYQQGWRLGGKGASGRNEDHGERIEEHGLHVWAGFYENAFRCLQTCYTELARAGIDGVFPTWRQAFEQQSTVTQHENVNGRWVPITTHWPTNDEVPGSGREELSEADYLQMLLAFLKQSFHRPGAAIDAQTLDLFVLSETLQPAAAWLAAVHRMETKLPMLSAIAGEPLHEVSNTALHLAERLFATARAADQRAPQSAHPELMSWLGALLQRFQQQLEHAFTTNLKDHEEQYAWYLSMSVAVATARGMVEEDVLGRGIDCLDALDLREFLARYGASDIVLQSSVLRGAYDYVFGYPDGDVTKPSLAAGVGLRGALRVFLTYKGAMMWKMRAGMGDTIFTPYYKLLAKRGIRFEFFSAVTNLGVVGTAIDSIAIDRQATLKNPAQGYQPLRRVGTLDCWPDRPDFAQLVDGDALAARGANFESFWNPPPPVAKVELKRGKDFDVVVLGIAPGAFPYIARELEANVAWKNMMAHTQTVQTLAMQLWLSPSLVELGWQYGTTISTSYVERWSTWADMSHLLPVEQWEAPAPRNLAYFCGVLADAEQAPVRPKPSFPQQQLRATCADADAWLDANIGYLWPRAVTPGGTFNRKLVVSSYVRVNVDPSERYVLTLPGTPEYRLRSDASGFDNLFLAGDWTQTSINAGCVEAATMSGLRAAMGASGQYIRIDDDAVPDRPNVHTKGMARQVS